MVSTLVWSNLCPRKLPTSTLPNVFPEPQANEAMTCDQGKFEENDETESGETESRPYQVVFPSSSLELLNMAFNILESSAERVSEARVKMAKLFDGEPPQDSKVCL